MHRRLVSAWLASFALLGCASNPLPMMEPGFGTIADTAVRQGTLANGLRYVVRANAEPMGRAELRLVVNAGSILEDDDQLGLAHVVEHMAFNGTRSFERQELVDYLESIGMRFGPDVNAYTTFDETVYMLTVPTGTPELLERSITILEEWATGITFDSLQIEQERGVVMEEWRIGQGAASRVQSQQFPTVARGSRYPDRMPIGTPSSLLGFKQDALRRFYRDWYRPDLMSVVAVGDFDPAVVEEMIRERFGSIPTPENARPRPSFEVPTHKQTLVSSVTDPELTSGTIGLYFKEPPVVWRNSGDVRQWLIQWLASSMLLNRLFEYSQLVDTPILDVSSFQGAFVRTLNTLVLNARVADGRAGEGLETLLMEVERAARHGFTESELDREKLDRLRALEQRFSERDKISSAAYVAEYVNHLLLGTSVLHPAREYDIYLRAMPSITVEDVNREAKKWRRMGDRVILVSSPAHEADTAPTPEEVVEIVQRSTGSRPRPYADETSLAELLPREPVPGSVVAEREIDEVDVLVWELSNGATVYLKPTDYREDEILFAARSPGGTSQYGDADHVPALTATAVVQAGGIGGLSMNDLRKSLAGTLAGVGADIGEAYEGLSGASTRKDLEILFKLAHLKFVAPRVDSTAFYAYQAQARATLLNRSASPDLAFQDTLRTTLTQNHPRSRPLSAELFDHVDLDRSFEIYRERFADASDFSFYLVGSFDPDEVRPWVERYLASLPSINRVEVARDLGIRPPSGLVQKVVRQGVEPRALTQIVFTGPFEFSRDNVLAIQTLADVLRIRLRETLREDLSGTYGVTVRGSGSPTPVPRYNFTIGFGADPARLDDLVAAVLAEIEALKVPAPEPVEVSRLEVDLSKVGEMQFRSRETEIRENSFWLNQMLVYDQYGWYIGDIPSSPSRAVVLQPEMIRETARRYLDPRSYIQVTLLPEAAPSQPTNSSPGEWRAALKSATLREGRRTAAAARGRNFPFQIRY